MSKFGREVLYTEYLTESIAEDSDQYVIRNDDDVIKVLQTLIPSISANKQEVVELFEFYRGKHPILEREKTIRPEINNKKTVNLQVSATRNIVGYTFSKPVTYIHKDVDKSDLLNELSDGLEALNKHTLDKERAEDASICGTSYLAVLPSMSVRGSDTSLPESILKLDPAKTEVIYYAENNKLPIMAITYYTSVNPEVVLSTNVQAALNMKYHYTIYTREKIYKAEMNATAHMLNDLSSLTITSSDINLLGEIPIVEYVNNQYRFGDWEIAKEILSSIENTINDTLNDNEQFVNSILALIGVELPRKYTTITLESGEVEEIEEIDYDALAKGILELKSADETSGAGDAKYLSRQMQSTNISSLIELLMTFWNVIVGLPDRKTNSDSGGDTGEAVTNRDGWRELEYLANIKEDCYKEAERKLIKLVLKCYELSNHTLDIEIKDIKIKFSRNKTDNLTNKANAISTLVNTNILNPTDILDFAEITNNIQDVIKRGEEYQEKRRELALEAQETIANTTKQVENQDEI